VKRAVGGPFSVGGEERGTSTSISVGSSTRLVEARVELRMERLRLGERETDEEEGRLVRRRASELKLEA